MASAAADAPTAVGAMSAETAALQQRLNRDLNCLSDENRGTRRSALKKFERTFFGKRADTSVSVIREFFVHCLCVPLLDRFSEPIESNREAAMLLFTRLCQVMNSTEGTATAADLAPTMDLTLPVIESRIGSLPFPETSEELRLHLVNLLLLFLRTPSCASGFRRHLSSLVQILGRASTDKYADVKKACAGSCVALCAAAPDIVHLHLEQLVRPQVANFTHHHKAVRHQVIKAVCELMVHGADGVDKLMDELVIPAIQGRITDRNAPVRQGTITVLARWMLELPDASHVEARLVSMLLQGLSDLTPALQAAALKALEQVGDALLKRDGGSGSADGGSGGAGSGAGAGAVDCGVSDAQWNAVEVMPEAFQSRRPTAGARALVRRLLARMLPPVLTDLQEWKAAVRGAAAGLLASMTAVAEDAVVEHLAQVLPALCRATVDDEATVRDSAAVCCSLLGRFVDPDAQLAILLPQARGEVSGLGTGAQRSATLAVLANAVSGMTSVQLGPHLIDLATTLVDPALGDGDPPALRRNLATCVRRTLESGGEATANPDVTRLLLRAVLHAQSYGPDEEVEETAVLCMDMMAALGGFPDATGLLEANIRGLLVDITKDTASWTKNSFNRCTFDVLMRVAGPAVAKGLDKALAVFQVTLQPSKEPELRLAQLALLKGMLGHAANASASGDGSSGGGGAGAGAGAGASAGGGGGGGGTTVELVEKRVAELGEALTANSRTITEDLLLPNTVWRVGRVAATIRKVSIFCLVTLLTRNLVPAQVFRAVYDQLIPPIKTCLGDDDSTTRKWSCQLLTAAFNLMQGRLTGEEASDMYHDLVKRLDDSNNEVRRCACDTLVAFVQAVESTTELETTPLEYTVDALLIHLDDPDEDVQRAVYPVLIAWAAMKPAFVIPRVQAARGRHRSPRYCDQAIEELTAMMAK